MNGITTIPIPEKNKNLDKKIHTVLNETKTTWPPPKHKIVYFAFSQLLVRSLRLFNPGVVLGFPKKVAYRSEMARNATESDFGHPKWLPAAI